MTSNPRARAAYWLLVATLFAAQAAYTRAGLERLWYEEVAEGIRNPFWLDHRLVYDGVSSNVGWYGLVLLVDKGIGFSPYAAKYVRLALHAPFLICTAVLLERWVGLRRAWMPLIAVGLSPTALYFNNLGTSYGTDLQLFPVVLLLIATIGDRGATARSAGAAALACTAGALTMLGCLMFPSFLIYVPVLAAFALWRVWPAMTARRLMTTAGWAAAGFVLPLIASVIYVVNRRAFLSDAAMQGSGVFRGGGQALTFDSHDLDVALSHLLRDLFVHGNTYYFNLPYVEFSGALGFAAAAGVVLSAIVAAWKWEHVRVPLIFAGALCLAAIAGPSATRHLPGLRRSTGVLAGFYVVVACLWAIGARSRGERIVVWSIRFGCVLLGLHHLIGYVPNYRYLAGETRTISEPWFYRFGAPDESVRTWARDWVLRGKPLECPSTSPCRYAEIYSAVGGYLKWNGLGEPPVLAIDPGTGQVVRLTPSSAEARPTPH